MSAAVGDRCLAAALAVVAALCRPDAAAAASLRTLLSQQGPHEALLANGGGADEAGDGERLRSWMRHLGMGKKKKKE